MLGSGNDEEFGRSLHHLSAIRNEVDIVHDLETRCLVRCEAQHPSLCPSADGRLGVWSGGIIRDMREADNHIEVRQCHIELLEWWAV